MAFSRKTQDNQAYKLTIVCVIRTKQTKRMRDTLPSKKEYFDLGHAYSKSIHALADLPRWQRKTTHTKPNKANSEQLYCCQPADMIPGGSITNHCTIVPLPKGHQATSVNPGHYSPNTSSLETHN